MHFRETGGSGNPSYNPNEAPPSYNPYNPNEAPPSYNPYNPNEAPPRYNPYNPNETYETPLSYNPNEASSDAFQRDLLIRNEAYGGYANSSIDGSMLVGGDEARFQDPAAANRQRIIETLQHLGRQTNDFSLPYPEAEIRSTIAEGRRILPPNDPLHEYLNDLASILNEPSESPRNEAPRNEAPETPGAYGRTVRRWLSWGERHLLSSENRGSGSSQAGHQSGRSRRHRSNRH